MVRILKLDDQGSNRSGSTDATRLSYGRASFSHEIDGVLALRPRDRSPLVHSIAGRRDGAFRGESAPPFDRIAWCDVTSLMACCPAAWTICWLSSYSSFSLIGLPNQRTAMSSRKPVPSTRSRKFSVQLRYSESSAGMAIPMGS